MVANACPKPELLDVVDQPRLRDRDGDVVFETVLQWGDDDGRNDALLRSAAAAALGLQLLADLIEELPWLGHFPKGMGVACLSEWNNGTTPTRGFRQLIS